MTVSKDQIIYRYGTADGHQPQALPEKASENIYAGTIAVTAAGYAKSATSGAASTDLVWGLYNGQYDSQEHTTAPMAGGTSNGLHVVGVDQGTFYLASATGPDAITEANIGAGCYVFDDVTVALTNSTGSRALAGTVMNIGGTTNAAYSGKVAVRLGAVQPITGGTPAGNGNV